MDGPPGEKVYTYYRYSSGINQQGIELAIKRDDDIDNYIQHYRHVLSTLDGLDALINTAKIQDIADPVIEDILIVVIQVGVHGQRRAQFHLQLSLFLGFWRRAHKCHLL